MLSTDGNSATVFTHANLPKLRPAKQKMVINKIAFKYGNENDDEVFNCYSPTETARIALSPAASDQLDQIDTHRSRQSGLMMNYNGLPNYDMDNILPTKSILKQSK